jgi:hypothetical protein
VAKASIGTALAALAPSPSTTQGSRSPGVRERKYWSTVILAQVVPGRRPRGDRGVDQRIGIARPPLR